MRKLTQITTCIAVVALLAVPAFADTLVLKSGERISGYYEGGSARVIKFRVNDGSVKDFDRKAARAGQDLSPGTGLETLGPGSFARIRYLNVVELDLDAETLVHQWLDESASEVERTLRKLADDAGPLSPTESFKKFKVPDNLALDLVLSDPNTQS